MIGVISNSLLLLLTYSNPLNNLRKSSWITITNLAAADLLTSISTIPFCHPVYYELMHASDMQYACAEVFLLIGYANSFFLLMLFSIERYIAIKYPIESGTILTRKRVFLACLLCWAAAIGCALPTILGSISFLFALYGILERCSLHRACGMCPWDNFNSLLLLLTYCNPLNNLRKSSWITITNLAVADLLMSILSTLFCHPV